jgi:hypothetical protein
MNNLEKYIWLIDLLQRKKRLNIDEICKVYWPQSVWNATGRNLYPKAVARWREQILLTFGIEIVCDHSDYTYYIKDLEELQQNLTQRWLLNTFSVNNMLAEYKDIRDRIILDPIMTDDERLRQFLDAIRERRRLRITYHRFQEAEARAEEEVEPYCVRCFHSRWYAVVRYLQDDHPKVLAFDRCKKVSLTETRFQLPRSFNAAEFFAFDYGMGVGFGEQPAEIVLRVKARQRKYLESLPLHPSQVEVEHHDDYSLYRLLMKPTRDLARAILPWGADIRVEAPEALRTLVREMALGVAGNNE